MAKTYTVPLDEEARLKAELDKRTDNEALRIKRYLSMPDLSRTPGSPIKEMVDRVLSFPNFSTFDVVEVPEVISVEVGFDAFDFPLDHVARSKSDTYYTDDAHILRTQMTVAWYYYFHNEEVQKRMAAGEAVGAFAPGKVYRKDEIDNRHMNVFHQLDGWYLVPKDKGTITRVDLEQVLADTAKAIFGPDVVYRFNPDNFPYTDPSLEMEVEIGGKWVEVNGAGVIKGSVLDKLGVDSSKWTGWAFGMGLERLAIISMELPDIRLLWSNDERVKKQLILGQQYKEVSKFPPVVRDISFVVGNDFVLNDYFDAIRTEGGDTVEQVEQTDKYENAAKFGEGKTSYTFRIVYRDLNKTLTNEEVNALHAKIEEMTKKDYNGEIRMS